MPSDDIGIAPEGRAAARYVRQAALPFIGEAGQRRLGSATVLIVGCGALGSVQAELTARAGIGKLVLADRDVLEWHNLQRQLLFDERDVRERLPKAEAAARRLRAVNSDIQIEAVVTDVTATTVAGLMGAADLVLDGTDNFETRYLLNDVAVRAGKPWVYGGVLGGEGTVMAVRPGQGPCLRCLLPDPPEVASLPTCETRGVLNTAVAAVAALQVTEALKLLVGDPAADFRLHTLDLWRGAFRAVPIPRRADCVCCGQRRFDFLESRRGSTATVLCGRNAVQITPEQPTAMDFTRLSAQLAPLGPVTLNGLVLEVTIGPRRLVVFPDGRVLVMGTTDKAEARSLVARSVGN